MSKQNTVTVFEENWSTLAKQEFQQPFLLENLVLKKVSLIVIGGKTGVKTLESLKLCPISNEVQVIKEPGLGFARDLGISCAKSNLIAMFDDDLILSPKLWELILNIQPREYFMCKLGEHVSSRIFVIHRDDYSRVGGFDPSIKFIFEDGDFAIRAKKVGLKLRIIPSNFYKHVDHQPRVYTIRRMVHFNFEYTRMLVKYKREVFRNPIEFFWRPFDYRIKLQDLTTKITFMLYWIIKGAD